MTPPTTKLVAMSGIHECALQITIAKMEEAGEGDYTGGLREILSLVRSLESGEAVNVPRQEIERLLANRNLPSYLYDRISGWLTSDTPKEKANAEIPVSGSDR